MFLFYTKEQIFLTLSHNSVDDEYSKPMKTLASWSVEDYHRMIKAGILGDRRVELLEGEIVEMSPEGPTHAFYGEEIADYLRSCLGEKALVREARPITLSDSEPEPDIAVVKPPRIRYRDRHPGPDDILLLIEISQSTQAYRKTMLKAHVIYALDENE